MAENMKLIQLAVHYIDKPAARLEFAPEVPNLDALSPEIQQFFLRLVADVWESEDSGSNRSANFNVDDSTPNASLVKKQLQNLTQSGDIFFEATKVLATRLYDHTPGTASPGLLAVLQIQQPPDPRIFVTILKIRHKDESFIRLASQKLTQLDVEKVEYMLLSNLQKGAIIPHPSRDSYDLKIVDKVVSGLEPAKYFSEAFLGCIAKKSDEHQIRRLLPELRRYAVARNLEFQTKQLPGVIAVLQQRDFDVTTPLLSEVVAAQQLFGPGFEPGDFENYINKESELGQVHIPKEQFRGRGKKQTHRHMIYKFTDRKLSGLTITGPAELLQEIVTFEGDTATFRIETTVNALDVDYE